MAFDFDLRKRLYAQCRDEPLPPDDPRYVDVDSLGLRGGEWCAQLAERFLIADQPTQILFTALPGSGKSTELLRLKKSLTEAGFLVVLIDAEQVLDLSATMDIPDLLAVMVHETEQRVLAAEGKSPQAPGYEPYSRRFWRWLTTTEIDVTKAEFKVADAFGLTAELKTRPTLREQVRRTVGNNMARFLSDIRDEFKQLDSRAKLAGAAKGLCVIFDSLEKARGTSTTFTQVLDSAEQVFARGAPYLRLPVHTLFTVPPELCSRITVKPEFMPMVKIWNPDGTPCAKGRQALRDLITHRIPETHHADLLGVEREARLTRIIEQSGGYFRDILRHLRICLETRHPPISDADFNRPFAHDCAQMRMFLSKTDVEVLSTVKDTGELPLGDAAQRDSVAKLITNNVLLHYGNGKTWYAVHPAARDIVT